MYCSTVKTLFSSQMKPILVILLYSLIFFCLISPIRYFFFLIYIYTSFRRKYTTNFKISF
ncbi:hypothetical protein IC575_007744 [Cucumis melo]